MFASENGPKSFKICQRILIVRQHGKDLFTGGSVISDYGLIFCPEAMVSS